jgi:hypothetical protein
LVLNDGYCMNIKQEPTTGVKTNKNVSSKYYYGYRLMVRCDQNNVILRCREHCQQFMVNMYVNMQTITILAIQSKKLRAEDSNNNC